jgi:D-glycero-D-manno-heptose 1,7-bisphosphate phosphatase
MNKAVFLDKDGTLIPDIPYNVDPERIQLSEHATTGLKQLQKQGYKIVVVSNQSGVARGLFSESALIGVENKIKQLLLHQDIKLNGFYYCPHHPQGVVEQYRMNCNCRKPAAGMLLKAAYDMNIDLANSWMVGDILNDVEAGNRAGCKTILIDNGNETEWIAGEYRQPTQQFKTIDEAAIYMLYYQSK